MATNIQIKRGSGSNTPSSLLQGEMAVNMDTGQLYYGSGSTKTPVNSYKFTNVTASGDIRASGLFSATSGSFDLIQLDDDGKIQLGTGMHIYETMVLVIFI